MTAPEAKVGTGTSPLGPVGDDGADAILEVHNLKKYFELGGGILGRSKQVIRAVDNVTFSIRRSETFGLVGESGCGKTTLGQTIIRLYDPTEGRIIFNGADISQMGSRELRRYRRAMQMIFQDPSASLDPRMTVGSIVSEPLNIYGIGTKEERRDRVRELLRVVGLNAYFTNRYPHEFSGGQRQRIGIARSLALNPDLVICDEPVSALDVSIQAQVLNLLKDLQSEFSLTYLFIAHNLSVVAHIADRIGVMYLGKLVEIASSDAVTERPKHPYTQALISAVPVADPSRQRDRIILRGDVPSPANPPSGCYFHPRCPVARPDCSEREPELRELEPGHWVACHYAT